MSIDEGRRVRSYALLSMSIVALLLFTACAQSAAPEPSQPSQAQSSQSSESSQPTQQAQPTAMAEPTAGAAAEEQSLSAIEYYKSKATWECAPGQEHWRSDGTPTRGGTFIKSGGSRGANHLDTSAPGGGHNSVQVYEHLVETRACFYEDTVMVPGLAKSWTVSGDGLVWTVKLNEKAKWHNVPPVNGRPFTSADVAFTIEHQLAGGQLRSSWTNVSHQEPDDNTIVLTLKEPNPDFLGNVLGERLQVMLPHEVKEQYGDFKTVAIGTGPYMMKEFKNNQYMELERTPNWRENGFDGKPLPYIDSVEFPVFSDYAAEIASMRAGQLNLNTTTGYLKRDFDAIMASNATLKGYQDIAPIPRGLWVNHKVKPFDDIDVRKALLYATNSDEIVELGYQGGAVRTGYLPTAITQYAWPVEKVQEAFKTDLDKAKEHLTKAGFGPDNPLKFEMTMGSVAQDKGGEVTQEQLKKIGVEVDVKVVPGFAAGFVRRLEYDAAWTGVSPASIFTDRWMGGFVRCGDSRNVTQMCDSELDRLSLAQGRELDPVKRNQLLDQLQNRLLEVAPFVPVLSLVYYRIYDCHVQNMPSTEYTQQLSGLSSAWLDNTKC